MSANNLASLLPLAALALAFALRGGRESFAFAAVFPLLAAALFVPAVRSTLLGRLRTALPFVALLSWCVVCLAFSPPLARHLYRLTQLTAYLIVILVAMSWNEDERRRLMMAVLLLALVDAGVFLARRIGDPAATGYLLGNPSYSGLLSAAGFLAALALTRDGSNQRRVAGALCGVLFATTLVLLRSRSALAGLLVGLWFVLPRKRFINLGLALAVGGLAAALLDRERALEYLKIDPAHPHEWLGRLTIWHTAIAGFLDRPLAGWGLGNFEAAYLRHQLPINDVLRFDRSSPFAHNDYLQLAVEAGLPALALFCWGLARFSVGTRGRENPSDAWARGTVALFAVAALFNFTVFLPFCGLLGAFALGFGLSSAPGRRDAAVRPWAPALAAGLCAVFTVFLVLNAMADRLAAGARASAAARLMPIRPDLWYASAMEAIERRDWIGDRDRESDIFTALQRAAALNPGDAFVWNRLGVVGMTVMAPPLDPRAAFDRALSLAPRHAPFWIDAGFERLEAGDVAEARRRFQTAAELEPHASIPRFALALADAKAGDSAGARRTVDEAAALHGEYADAVALSGYAAYLFGLDESQMRSRVQHMLAGGKTAPRQHSARPH